MITKSDLESLGFHRSAENKKYFYKAGFQAWVLEVEPGNTYIKVAVQEDFNESAKDSRWSYFNTIEGLERYFEQYEPVNPNFIEKLQKSFAAPYNPKLYNDKHYHYPDSAWD